MSDNNQDKYPKIITDDEKQAINPSMKYPLTVEEYYDLLHHTHDVSSLISGGNSEMTDDINTNIAIINNNITNLTTTIQELQQTIIEQNQTIINIQESINSLNDYVDQDIQAEVGDNDGL